MKPCDMERVIDRKRYSTKAATQLSGDDYWDGHNFERSGRNTFLYRTAKGRYFTQHLTSWEDESDTLAPCTIDEAVTLFENMREKRVSYEEAFPGLMIEEA